MFTNKEYLKTNLIFIKLNNLLTMPWEKLSKDDFINCMVGRLQGDNEYDDEIKIKREQKVNPERAKLVNGKILGDTGDMILVEQLEKSFKLTYEEFIKIEMDNQNKIAELTLKIKRISKRFQDLFHMNSEFANQNGINFDQLVGITVESISNLYGEETKQMKVKFCKVTVYSLTLKSRRYKKNSENFTLKSKIKSKG